MSDAVLSIACKCGRRASAPCPTLLDTEKAQQSFVGWSYDAHGFARCPDCTTKATGEEKRA